MNKFIGIQVEGEFTWKASSGYRHQVTFRITPPIYNNAMLLV